MNEDIKIYVAGRGGRIYLNNKSQFLSGCAATGYAAFAEGSDSK